MYATSQNNDLFINAGRIGLCFSLSVYQDTIVYAYAPQNRFIGFSNNVRAKCRRTEAVVQSMFSCPEEERLCKELGRLKGTAEKLKAVQTNISLLNTFTTLPQPASLDAENWIAAAKRVSGEQAKLSTDETHLKGELQLLKRAFRKQAPVQNALYLSKECKGDLSLELPYGQVAFQPIMKHRSTKRRRSKSHSIFR